MVMSDGEILQAIEDGAIVITDFDESRLNTASYDIRLAENFYRMNPKWRGLELNLREISAAALYECRYQTYRDTLRIQPGEYILGHSAEVCGGTVSKCGTYAVTTEMKGTSTAARAGISTHPGAGWGDVGFLSPWTMEISNETPHVLEIPIGSILAQIVFHKIAVPVTKTYDKIGNYHHEEWNPEMMLPKRIKVR